MKTKNIFKMLAFAMLMPAMMLTTACSSEDDIVNTPEKTENTTGKVYEIPITINATRQGDDATTRAEYTYDSSTGLGHLSFTTGDQLFVSGEHQLAGNFSGTLNWDGGTVFIGTIRTTNGYSGTAIELLNSADYCDAFLLPEGYTDYNYFTISKVNPNDPNSIESVTTDVTEAFITSKTTAIEQFSEEWASWKRYDDEQGFALFPQNAILNFTITGLTPNSNTTTVSFHYPQAGKLNWSINKTVQTDNTGTAKFAIGLSLMKAVFEDLKNFSLSVDEKDITLVTESKTLRAGHIYNITRSATPAAAYTMAANAVAGDVGNLICTDGHIHAYGADAACTKVRVAKIVYVGSSTGDATYNHGLALALTDESSNNGMGMDWNNAMTACNAKNTSATVESASWMLPSKTQWETMGATSSTYTTLRDGFISVGGSNLTPVGYWSSTEFDPDPDNAWVFFFDEGVGVWEERPKVNGGNPLVRACLAF